MKQAAKKMAFAAVAGVGMVVGASAVMADFVITDTVTTTGGVDDHVLRAFNTGTNGTGTALQGFDVTITTPGTTSSTALVVDLTDVDGDGSADANIFGSGLAFGSTAGTFARVGTSVNLTNFTGISAQPTPYETDPTGSGAPTTTLNPLYTSNNVHSLEIVGVNTSAGAAASTAPGTPFANIVVPTGTTFQLTGQLGGNTGNPVAVSFPTAVTTGTSPIVSLTTAAPSAGFGTSLGTLTVTGPGHGSYNVATLSGLSNASGYVQATGFNPATDPELYGLDVLINGSQASAADIAALVADINASGNAVGGLVASNVSPSSSLPSNDNLFLSELTPTNGTNFLGFNFTSATGLSGTATVAAVSVVPEPASIGMIVGAFGLLAARRRRMA